MKRDKEDLRVSEERLNDAGYGWDDNIGIYCLGCKTLEGGLHPVTCPTFQHFVLKNIDISGLPN